MVGGSVVGTSVGACEGSCDGRSVGESVGACDGVSDGVSVGVCDGADDGDSVGVSDGAPDGSSVGVIVGVPEGASVGGLVGSVVDGAVRIGKAVEGGRTWNRGANSKECSGKFSVCSRHVSYRVLPARCTRCYSHTPTVYLAQSHCLHE